MFDFLSQIGDRIGDVLSSYLWFDWDEPGDGTGSRPKGRMEVPDVRGLTVEDARLVLSREGFRAEILQLEERPAPVMGTVVDQNPSPGTRRHRSRPVRIDVAHPRESRTRPH
jgi:beta-lactam-binding protein with PASTA domain